MYIFELRKEAFYAYFSGGICSNKKSIVFIKYGFQIRRILTRGISQFEDSG